MPNTPIGTARCDVRDAALVGMCTIAGVREWSRQLVILKWVKWLEGSWSIPCVRPLHMEPGLTQLVLNLIAPVSNSADPGRTCRDCGATKTLDEFQAGKDARSMTRRCRQCRNAKCRAFRAAKLEACRAKNREWYDGNRARCAERMRKRRRRLREQAFDAYGKTCRCCNETAYEFLTIDHVGGGGREHRALVGNAYVYDDLEKRGYPPGFRTLCFNCNCAIGVFGFCPHTPGERYDREKLGRPQVYPRVRNGVVSEQPARCGLPNA